MLRSSWLKNGVVLMTACFATLSMLSYDAMAQVKAFKIKGAGVAPMGLPLPNDPDGPRPHTVVGTATHLGKHHGMGSIQTYTADFQSDASIIGTFGSGDPFIFTGANGDILSCNYGKSVSENTLGNFMLIPVNATGVYRAVFVAEFVPISAACTGKFKGVEGSWVMYAVTGPFALGSSAPIPYSWEGSGELTFKKEK